MCFLGYMFALFSPDKTHDLYELLDVKLASAGIRLHTEKRGVGIEAVEESTGRENLRDSN